ncbi:methyl-accepting chemotaxis protein [Peribacillus sp. NPDC097224]|uniref:methyl-accepting chemotaxis protein n=1 Tax=Peribacillus sp. NPDC097224 TaxID=3364399 RepID=UPI003811AEE0
MKRLKNWYFNSLKKQILIPFLALIIISGFLISYVAYDQSIELTTDELKNTTEGQVKSMNEVSDRFFQEKEKNLDRISKDMAMTTPHSDADSILTEFTNTQTTNEEIISLYMGTEKEGQTIIFPKAYLPGDFDPRQQDWYQEALKGKNEVIWTEPYTDTATNSLIITAAKAIYDGDKLVGVLGVDIAMETLLNTINQTKFGKTGYAILLNEKGSILAHPDQSKIMKDLSAQPIFQQMKGESGSMILDFEDKRQIIGYSTSPTTGWKIAGVVDRDEVVDRASSMVMHNILAMIVTFTLATIFSIFITRSLTKPIKRLQESIKKMAGGDFASTISISSGDELGKLAEDTNTLAENMSAMLKNVHALSNKVADSSMLLVASAEENSAAANEVAMTMEQIASGAIDQIEVGQDNETAIELMADKINNLENQAEKMSLASDDMFKASENGMITVQGLKQQFDVTAQISNQMSTAVKSLDVRSHTISDIVKTITGIAGQTNLLALNAAIEAARAGEHGKGFAVVADEVKKLAEQTEHSLKEIAEIIFAMQTDTANTVSLIDQVNQKIDHQSTSVTDTEVAFGDIASIISTTFSNFDEITSTMHEMIAQIAVMSGNAKQLNSVSQEAAAGTEEVSASIEETNASMEQLNALAGELDSLSQEMHKEIQKFSY